jgi:hypothetical protein
MLVRPEGNLSALVLDWQAAGDQELIARLSALSYRLQIEALTPAVREIGDRVAADASSRAPVEIGLLAESIGRSAVKKYKGERRGLIYIAVGPRRGFRRAIVRGPRGRRRLLGEKATAALPEDPEASFRDPVRYAHLVEGGRQAVRAKPGHVLYSQGAGRFFASAKAAAAKPFIAPSREDAEGFAPAIIEDRVSQFLAAESL